eukprot:619208-Karenia_brevis.AAC.1
MIIPDDDDDDAADDDDDADDGDDDDDRHTHRASPRNFMFADKPPWKPLTRITFSRLVSEISHHFH